MYIHKYTYTGKKLHCGKHTHKLPDAKISLGEVREKNYVIIFPNM